MAATDLRPELLAAADWGALPDALPILVLSLVYHNVIPSVAASLEGDAAKIRRAAPLQLLPCWMAAPGGSRECSVCWRAGRALPCMVHPPRCPFRASGFAHTRRASLGCARNHALPAPAPSCCLPPRCRQAIVLGLSLPLAMFLVWDGVVLGSSGGALLLEAGAAAGGDPLAALRATSPEAAGLVDAFAFLAVATSFIGFLLGLTEFIADALQVRVGRSRSGQGACLGSGGTPQHHRRRRCRRHPRLQLPTGARAPLPYLLALAPPLAGGILYPGAFFTALDFAGT